eukprot:1225347-Prymnesium_polylepis.1
MVGAKGADACEGATRSAAVAVQARACKQYRIKPRLAISTLQELTPTVYVMSNIIFTSIADNSVAREHG